MQLKQARLQGSSPVIGGLEQQIREIKGLKKN